MDLLSAPAARLATLARSAGFVVRQKLLVFSARDPTKHLSMIVDSGPEVRLGGVPLKNIS